jgi:cbb3-type cytochrome oxidase subunit 1
MKGIAFGFMVLAVCLGILGMIWGIQMAASQDHTLANAHAHLNLIGWVGFALYGLYYHVVPSAAQGRLPRLHLAISVLAVGTIAPGIAITQSGGGDALAILGSFLTLASALIFLLTVIRSHAA